VNDLTAKVLITMEHAHQRTLIGDCLEHVGHDVTKVDTFHNAMDILRNADFDLIVSDVHLQNGGSVFDFLRWVKGDPYMRATPFVCFSAEPPEIGKYLADGVRTAARSLGAARFITMERFNGPCFGMKSIGCYPKSKSEIITAATVVMVVITS